MNENDQPYFSFQHDDMRIALYGNLWNGKEQLYVNDQLVSEARSLGFGSKHGFEWRGQLWQLEFKSGNGEALNVDCQLLKQGELVFQQNLPFKLNGKLGKMLTPDPEPLKKEADKPQRTGHFFAFFAIGFKLLKSAKVIQVGLVGASVASYSFLFDWRFAVIIVMALMFHEYGHMQAMKKLGMKVKGMYLIPFVGGAAVSADRIKTRWENVFISMMGPTYGLVLTLVFFGVYQVTGHSLAAGLASFSALLNLINLLPIIPLDGGQVVKSIAFSLHSKLGTGMLWLGIALSVVITWNIGLSLFAFLTIIGVLDLLFGSPAKREAAITPLNNTGTLLSVIWYLGCIAALIGMILLMADMGMAGSQLVSDILNS